MRFSDIPKVYSLEKLSLKLILRVSITTYKLCAPTNLLGLSAYNTYNLIIFIPKLKNKKPKKQNKDGEK